MDKLLWDIAIIEGGDEAENSHRQTLTGKQASSAVAGMKGSVADRIRRKRQLMGIV